MISGGGGVDVVVVWGRMLGWVVVVVMMAVVGCKASGGRGDTGGRGSGDFAADGGADPSPSLSPSPSPSPKEKVVRGTLLSLPGCLW